MKYACNDCGELHSTVMQCRDAATPVFYLCMRCYNNLIGVRGTATVIYIPGSHGRQHEKPAGMSA